MPEITQKIMAALRRDPRRTAVLVLLLLIAALLVVRQRNGGPSSVVGLAEQSTIDPGSPGAAAVPNIGRSAELLKAWREQPVAPISRNLFVSELTTPLAKAEPPSRQEAAPSRGDGLFWRQLEQALAARADREQYRRTLEEAALRDAGVLSLTSIVLGPDTRAMIGDRFLQVGETVGTAERGPFMVVAIEAKRVILARDGHRVALTLGRPGAELDVSR